MIGLVLTAQQRRLRMAKTEWVIIASVTILAEGQEDAERIADEMLDKINQVTEAETYNSWDIDDVLEAEV